ncbi:hypothetical protein [Brevibacillus laterosporus]
MFTYICVSSLIDPHKDYKQQFESATDKEALATYFLKQWDQQKKRQ